MKTAAFLVAVAAMIFCSLPASAQDESSAMIDGSLYDLAFSWKSKNHFDPENMESHWAGLGFAFSDLRGLPSGIDLNLGRSYSICWNVEDYELPLNHHWLLATGFGFDWSRWHFDRGIIHNNGEGNTEFGDVNMPLDDSKLLIYYAKLPLLFEYQTRFRNRTFFVTGGVEGTVKLYSKSQIKAVDGSRETYRKLKINPVNARLYLKVGFCGAGVFCYYQPFSMFQSGRGPEIRNFGVGIALN
jgi:hypothetical protein